MACAKCGAPCQGRHCQTHRIEASHNGMSAGNLGWRRGEDEDDEGEDGQ